MRENAQQILEIINNSDEHLTAEQVYLRLKEKNSKAVLATVYNNLASLYQKGLIRKVAVAGFPDRYDKMEVRHDHLVCKQCGSLTDIMLEDLTAKLEQETGIHVLSYDLNIDYLCPTCAAELEEGKTRKLASNNCKCSS